MDEMIQEMLKMQLLSGLRADETISRQSLMNHGTAAHFLDMMMIRDSCEVSVPEGFAIQGLAMAQAASLMAGMKSAGGT